MGVDVAVLGLGGGSQGGPASVEASWSCSPGGRGPGRSHPGGSGAGGQTARGGGLGRTLATHSGNIST